MQPRPDIDDEQNPQEKETASLNTFGQYLQEIRRYPLLNRNEELSLAQEYYRTKNAGLKQELVTANLRLVVKIAKEYYLTGFTLFELVQEGNVGLIHGVEKFNPNLGTRINTYVQWWIRAYILKFIMDNFRMIKVGTTTSQRQIFYKLHRAARQLFAESKDATPAAIAEAIKCDPALVEIMMQKMASTLSLDQPSGKNGDGTLMDTIHDLAPSPEQVSSQQKTIEMMRKMIDEVLEPKNYSGRNANKGQIRDKVLLTRLLAETRREMPTLEELGKQFGITRERTRQLEGKLLRRMRERLEQAGIFSSMD